MEKIFFSLFFLLFSDELLQSRMHWHRGWGGHLSLTPLDNTWLLTDLNFSTLCPAAFVAVNFCPSAKVKMASGGIRQQSGLSHHSCCVDLMTREGSVWSSLLLN